jgi:dipicolinate synthase subunit A
MTNCYSFGVLGGDRRQIALAESIASDGYTVTACGFDDVIFSREVKKAGLEETAELCENIILPLPITADGKHLKMDFSDQKILLDDNFAELLRGKQVFGGMMGRLYQTSDIWESIDTYDYFTREEFAVRNVVPTAEGAIGIAMQEYPGTISGSKCLVAGFGRIGKILSWMLRGIGAKVTVSARKQSDIAWINSYGYDTILTAEIGGRFDIVFNTIPAVIFDHKVLARLHGRPLLIDLASPPGGVDYDAAESCGFQVIHALSLPGKVAPKAAGEIIKHTIYNIMEE